MSKYSAKIIADSISAEDIRMTTMEIEYPRFILAELNTHRLLSKNSASSRAIPTKIMLDTILQDPATPVFWGMNQPGMSAKEELEDTYKLQAQALWYQACSSAIGFSKELATLELHKQIVNRITEPWMTMKTVISGTEWSNFYYLRNHKDAQPEIKELARLMYEAHTASTPQLLSPGEWHVPYVNTYRAKGSNELMYTTASGCPINLHEAKIISASCCAQVSYRKNDDSMQKAKKIFDQLINSTPAHASPVEHQATPMDLDQINWTYPEFWPQGVTHFTRIGELWSGNLRGWIQHRKQLKNEAVWGTIPYKQ